MRICCHFHRQPIAKAKSKVRTTANYKKIEALSTRMQNAVKVNLVDGIETFKKKVSAAAIERAWELGQYDEIMRIIPWEKMPDHFESTKTSLLNAAARAGAYTIESLPANARSELRFDTKNPAIDKFLDQRTGNLITAITDNTKDIVQNTVRMSFDQAMTPRRAADIIKDSIGLDPRRHTALENYRTGLLKSGMKEEKAIALSDKYEAKLLDSRAMTIARTEIRRATNQGQLDVWQEGAKQGLINPTAKKVWVVDGNPCEICEPMDGVGVPLDGVWNLNTGDVVDIPTDSHPNCYCGMELDFGSPEED